MTMQLFHFVRQDGLRDAIKYYTEHCHEIERMVINTLDAVVEVTSDWTFLRQSPPRNYQNPVKLAHHPSLMRDFCLRYLNELLISGATEKFSLISPVSVYFNSQSSFGHCNPMEVKAA